MKISTKGRYALRTLVDLAQNADRGFVSLSEVSERQNISKKYLEQIIPMLSRAGFLQTKLGLRGGYRLAKPAAECSVGDILRATEGSLAPVACVENRNECDNCDVCQTLPIWKNLAKVVAQYLDSVSVQDVIDQNVDLEKELFFENGQGI